MLRQRLPRLDRDLAVGLRRQAQDRLDGVDVGLEPRLAGRAGARAVERAQELDLVLVFQPMPLPPLPSFSSSGPSEVNRA